MRDEYRMAWLSMGLGFVSHACGEYAAAEALYHRALLLLRRAGDIVDVAMVLSNLGAAAEEQGKLAEAQARLEESLDLTRELADRTGIAYPLINLGVVSLKQGHYRRSIELFREALRLGRDLEHRFIIVNALGHMVELAEALGESERAIRLGGAEQALREQLGIPIEPIYREARERALARARSLVGEESWGRLWAQGSAMTLDEAVDFGLAADGV